MGVHYVHAEVSGLSLQADKIVAVKVYVLRILLARWDVTVSYL